MPELNARQQYGAFMGVVVIIGCLFFFLIGLHDRFILKQDNYEIWVIAFWGIFSIGSISLIAYKHFVPKKGDSLYAKAKELFRNFEDFINPRVEVRLTLLAFLIALSIILYSSNSIKDFLLKNSLGSTTTLIVYLALFFYLVTPYYIKMRRAFYGYKK